MVGYSVHDIDYLRLIDIDYPPVRDIDYPLVRAPVDSDEVAVLIATPNLCLDRTEMVSAIVPGGVMRARSVEVTAGGKGVNVARVLRSFGQHPPIVGLVAERNGAELLELLAGVNRKHGSTVVIVTHNAPIAAMADRVVRMSSGSVSEVSGNASPAPPERIEW